MERWRGKVAIVTGASAGIGRTIAEKLVEHGLVVVGLARRKHRLEELELKLKNEQGKFYGLRTDISKKEDILAAFKWIDEHLGPISLLVNNAGFGFKEPIINANHDIWKQILDTNVYGLTIATNLAITNMKENGIDDGHIININSVAGHGVLPCSNQNVYPASKFAVTAFTETVRKELAAIKSKIRITSISPGLVDTEIFEVGGYYRDPEFANILKNSPLLSTDDVANAVLFAVGNPPHVHISEVIIRPTGEIF